MRRMLLFCVAIAGCDGGGGTPDATPAVDAPAATDALPTPDAPPAPDAMPPPPGTACSTAIELVADTGPVASTTAFSGNAAGASCSGGATSAPERYFVVDAGDTAVDLVVEITVDEAAMQPFDVVATARATCADPTSELACSDSGWGERLEVLAVTGPVYILVDGTDQFMGASSGAFEIDVRRRTLAGFGQFCDGVTARCGVDLVCQDAMCVPTSPTLACTGAPDLTADLLADGEAFVDGEIFLTDPDYYTPSCAFDPGGNDPERVFRFDLAATATVTASTNFPETTYDTNLVLRAGTCDADELLCADDVDAAAGEFRTVIAGTSLPPGTYYLFVDMSSAWVYGPAATTPRQFRLRVTAEP